MKRLRTLAGIALIAGIFTGLTSCANKKGDLGAELDTQPIVAEADGARHTPQHVPAQAGAADTVQLDAGAADTVDIGDPKNRAPQSVSINRDAKAKPAPAADPQSGQHLPEAAQGEVVAIPTVPVQPAPVPAATAKPEAVKVAPTENAPKDEAKEIAVKPEVKKVEPAPIVVAPAAPVVEPSKDVAKATPREEKVVAKEEAPKVEVKPEVKKVEPAPIVVAPAAPVVEHRQEDVAKATPQRGESGRKRRSSESRSEA